VVLVLLALGTAAKAGSVSVQSEFNGSFGINFPVEGTSSGLLIFPGPYQLTFQTTPFSQTNTVLGVTVANYGPGGSVDVLGPNGFQLSGTFTDAVSKIFPLDSEQISSFNGAFTGLLTDGEHWQGTFGVDIHSLEPSPMFLQMSGPVSTPEPDTLGMMAFGLGALAWLSQRRRLSPRQSPQMRTQAFLRLNCSRARTVPISP
jgi:hypothetical protein